MFENYGLAFILTFALCFAVLYLICRIKRSIARSVAGERIPVSVGDTMEDYRKAVKIIKRRWYATAIDMVLKQDDFYFRWYEPIEKYYPAIAFFRYCHMAGYEVEIRPMRPEDSPLENGEVVARMSDSQWKEYSGCKREGETV